MGHMNMNCTAKVMTFDSVAGLSTWLTFWVEVSSLSASSAGLPLVAFDLQGASTSREIIA